MGSSYAGDHSPAVDVADEYDWYVCCTGKSHVRDITFSQIDLGRAAGAFDQNDVRLLLEQSKAF